MFELKSTGGERVIEGDFEVYMHPVEFSQLLAIVESCAPKDVLEWGAGGSTAALLREFPFIRRYVSVEHNQQWYEKVRAGICDDRLTLLFRPPSVPEPTIKPRDRASRKAHASWSRRCEHEPDLLRDYISDGADALESYDFVLVDGRARSFCIRAGWEKLRPGGVLVVHDAQREDYRQAIAGLGRARYLEPWHQGQVCLIRRS